MAEEEDVPDFLSNLVLGQRQPAFRDAILSFSGEVSDLHIWSRFLSAEEVVDITSGRNVCKTELTGRLKGDLISWEDQEWRKSEVGMTIVNAVKIIKNLLLSAKGPFK